MQSVTVSILLAFIAKAYAREEVASPIDDGQHTLETNKLADKVFGRSLKASLHHHADLENTTLGKSGHLSVPVRPSPLLTPSRFPAFFHVRGMLRPVPKIVAHGLPAQRDLQQPATKAESAAEDAVESSRREFVGASLTTASIVASQAAASAAPSSNSIYGSQPVDMSSRPKLKPAASCPGPQAYSKNLFDNDRISIEEFFLPPGGTATVCARYPTVRWQVDAAYHALKVDRAEEVEAKVFDKQVFWVDSGSTWRVQNLGQEPYRQIVWEIKQPPKYSEEEVRSRLRRAKYSTNVGTELLMENKFCRVWDFNLPPGGGDPSRNAHHHTMDYAFVYVAPGRLIGYYPDGSPGLFDDAVDNNGVRWFNIPDSAPEDPLYAHAGKNGYKDKPMREYLVELK